MPPGILPWSFRLGSQIALEVARFEQEFEIAGC